jgi:hypothetical protein
MIELRPTTVGFLLAGAFLLGWACYDTYIHIDRDNAHICPVCYRPLDHGSDDET